MPEAPDFEALYRRDPDPFRVRTSWYERRKQGIVLASLCRQTYPAAWDVACGTGDLALALAPRCTQLLATDDSERAVQLTAELTTGTQVDVRHHSLPADPATSAPPTGSTGPFDLIVLAEVLYYLTKEARMATYALVDDAAKPVAEVVAVHWRHRPHDAHLSGADVNRELGEVLARRRWSVAVRHDDQDFALTSWVREAAGQEAG
ncbi:class I SAM-dependent methyltransferase [Segeticoccus rhizosphaerae]|jgi:SAM-dependent methyltransferase|uniref:class I SAM-dependent methyltransferase n=1 Tax=Segeticoccus rhizosphaerae TaxID=1104777 RepID=UPI0010BF6895|nr:MULTISPECIES: class I SAM-dependent methyltransferase [Intrasporangiaceae]